MLQLRAEGASDTPRCFSPDKLLDLLTMRQPPFGQFFRISANRSLSAESKTTINGPIAQEQSVSIAQPLHCFVSVMQEVS